MGSNNSKIGFQKFRLKYFSSFAAVKLAKKSEGNHLSNIVVPGLTNLLNRIYQLLQGKMPARGAKTQNSISEAACLLVIFKKKIGKKYGFK